MKRLPFLDWMRGLAVVVMILCHVFNAFTRADLRGGGPYIVSQLVGGMAAPLFLFMAGITLAFQMDRLERRQAPAPRRWLACLRRGMYILAVAFLFRFTNWALSSPRETAELTKVDILNCMGVALMAFSAAAVFGAAGRVRFGVVAGLGIGLASPVVAHMEWGATPVLLRQYLAPGLGAGHFPFFPFASQVGFGLAVGTLVKRAGSRMEPLMRWNALMGVALILVSRYLADTPGSIYPQSNFWTDSPLLVLIDLGIMQMLLSLSYLWTEFGASTAWSWMQCLGKNSLMVYWIHLVLVYGGPCRPLRGILSIPWTAAATAATTALMTGMSAGWLWWKTRRS